MARTQTSSRLRGPHLARLLAALALRSGVQLERPDGRSHRRPGRLRPRGLRRAATHDHQRQHGQSRCRGRHGPSDGLRALCSRRPHRGPRPRQPKRHRTFSKAAATPRRTSRGWICGSMPRSCVLHEARRDGQLPRLHGEPRAGHGRKNPYGIQQLTAGTYDDLTPIWTRGSRIAFVTNQMYTEMGTRADEYNHGRGVTQLATISESGGDADRKVCSQNLSHIFNPFRMQTDRLATRAGSTSRTSTT